MSDFSSEPKDSQYVTRSQDLASRVELSWVEAAAQEQKRRSLFTEMTAITVHDINWRSKFNIIEAQRHKIEALKLQMSQMNRGYQRKIAKLERRCQEYNVALAAKTTDKS